MKPTEEEIKLVAEMLEKKLSASQIGEKLGRTRNSIIGMVHRNPDLKKIGLQGNSSGGRAKEKNIEVWLAAKTASRGPFKDIRVSKEKMTLKNCQWIYGDPKIHYEFCGHKKHGNSSYCAHHFGIVYQKG